MTVKTSLLVLLPLLPLLSSLLIDFASTSPQNPPLRILSADETLEPSAHLLNPRSPRPHRSSAPLSIALTPPPSTTSALLRRLPLRQGDAAAATTRRSGDAGNDRDSRASFPVSVTTASLWRQRLGFHLLRLLDDDAAATLFSAAAPLRFESRRWL